MRRRFVTARVGVAAAALSIIVATLLTVAPAAAGGPVTVTYPGPDCPSGPTGLQDCIDAFEAGSTIHVAMATVDEDIDIDGGITIDAAPGSTPTIDSFDISITGSTSDIVLRRLTVAGGIWAKFDGGSGHSLTIERVKVLGTFPNTGSGIYVQGDVPITFDLIRSRITSQTPGFYSVAYDMLLPSGATTFRAIGNRISQRGGNGSAGLFVRASNGGTHRVDLMNNSIWAASRCGCGLAANIALIFQGSVDADVNVIGNTLERSTSSGLGLINDVDKVGSISLDLFDNVISHARGAGISFDNRGPVAPTFRNGYNDLFRNGPNQLDGESLGPSTLTLDPRFVDRANGNLRLRSTSPLVDAGRVCTPGGTADPDAAGRHRRFGSSVDIGAYERGAPVPNGIVHVGDGTSEEIQGTAGRDILCGYGDGDLLEGFGGADYLDGGSGPDTIFGDGGPDRMFGRGGSDLLCANDGAGSDLVDGGQGLDRRDADPGDTLVSVEQKAPCIL